MFRIACKQAPTFWNFKAFGIHEQGIIVGSQCISLSVDRAGPAVPPYHHFVVVQRSDFYEPANATRIFLGSLATTRS